jgi:hypothetical protein
VLREERLCCQRRHNASKLEILRELIFRPSVADPGCLSRIPYPNIFHPGFEFFHPGTASKNLSILMVSRLSEYDHGCSSRIRVKKVPDPDRIRIRNTIYPDHKLMFRGGRGGRDIRSVFCSMEKRIVTRLYLCERPPFYMFATHEKWNTN